MVKFSRTFYQVFLAIGYYGCHAGDHVHIQLEPLSLPATAYKKQLTSTAADVPMARM